jgi:hypothetical protein
MKWRAYLLYVNIRATSRESAKGWPRRQVNIGENAGKYTYRLTCR